MTLPELWSDWRLRIPPHHIHVHVQVMLHSYSKVVMWLYQSWNLTGAWNSSVLDQGFGPSSPDHFPSFRVGCGDETTRLWAPHPYTTKIALPAKTNAGRSTKVTNVRSFCSLDSLSSSLYSLVHTCIMDKAKLNRFVDGGNGPGYQPWLRSSMDGPGQVMAAPSFGFGGSKQEQTP